MEWLIFVVLTLLALGFTFGIYALAQVFVGWCVGATLEAVSVGFGPAVLDSTIRGIKWRIGIIPLGGGGAKFFTRDVDDAGKSDAVVKQESNNKTGFDEVALVGRVAMILVGPLSSVFIGLACVAIPIWNGSEQVVVRPDLPAQWKITGVPHLTVVQKPSTWASQKELLANTTLEYVTRFVTFKSLDGWGGLLAWLSTLGLAGTNSLTVWLSCFGVTMIGTGAANLLPIPLLPGGQLMLQLSYAILGKLADRFLFVTTIFGFLFVLFIWGRLIFLDVRWIWGVISA